MIDTACTWDTPIYVDVQDVFSDSTARSILTHNKAYAANCESKIK